MPDLLVGDPVLDESQFLCRFRRGHHRISATKLSSMLLTRAGSPAAPALRDGERCRQCSERLRRTPCVACQDVHAPAFRDRQHCEPAMTTDAFVTAVSFVRHAGSKPIIALNDSVAFRPWGKIGSQPPLLGAHTVRPDRLHE